MSVASERMKPTRNNMMDHIVVWYPNMIFMFVKVIAICGTASINIVPKK